MPATTSKSVISHKRKSAAGMKGALNILAKWKCSNDEIMKILCISKAAFHKYKNSLEVKEVIEVIDLTNDQLERISYVLNIYAYLGLIFENPNNRDGFMRMKNDNSFFNGKSPLEIIGTGNFGALYETHKRIDALRGGQW